MFDFKRTVWVPAQWHIIALTNNAFRILNVPKENSDTHKERDRERDTDRQTDRLTEAREREIF